MSVCYVQNFISACSSKSACQLCFVLLIFLVSCCCGITPAVNQALHSLNSHSMQERLQESIGRVKVMGSDNDNLIAKAKVVHTSKAKQGVHSPLPTGRHIFSYLGKQGFINGENKGHHFKCPNFVLFPPAFNGEHYVIWYGTLLESLGLRCSGCAPPELLVHPHLPH